jgi:hypothetical protein
MKVFVFDLLAYGEQLEHLKVGNSCPTRCQSSILSRRWRRGPMPNNACHERATGSPPTICRSASAPMSLTAKPRRCARWGRIYFNRTLFSHGNFTETELQRQTGYASTESTDYVSPENRCAAQFAREDFRNLTMAEIERQAEQMPWGTAVEVTERIIEAAESAGADNVQISLNRGVLPHGMFMEQLRRFAGEVLPALQAVEHVPLAEEIAA